MYRPALVLLAALTCLLSGCHVNAPHRVRIAINAWPGYEFLYLAQELGYLSTDDYEIRVIEMGSLASVRRAFERGHLDGMGGTLVDVAIAADGGAVEPTIIIAADVSEGADAIVARQGLSSVRDLAGKTVAVESASLNLYILARALELAGMGFEDIDVLTLDAGSMAAALASGRADAVVTYPPVLTELLRSGNVSVVFTSAEIPGEVVDVLAVDAALMQQHPGAVDLIKTGFFRAYDYSLGNPDAAAVMATREGISVAEFRAALEDIEMIPASRQDAWLGAGGMLRQVLRRVSDTLYANGLVTSPSAGDCCIAVSQEPARRQAAAGALATR
ncbi:MAG: ABC transporter substrate-binding protein [Gammaproteobacteria bacterium]|nr:ABC transporter substrate-binding protein [Gammaproteobacteria bacterium]